VAITVFLLLHFCAIARLRRGRDANGNPADKSGRARGDPKRLRAEALHAGTSAAGDPART